MEGGSFSELVWYIGALVLVGSALVARRIPLGTLAKTALAWIAIFMVVYGLFLFRDDFSALWDRARADMGGTPELTTDGEAIVLRREPDGHFWINTQVNGISTRFLIDTGATTTSLSVAAARAANVEVDTSGFPVAVNTANGTTLLNRATISTLRIGGTTLENQAALVGESLGSTSVLGMNILDKMGSYQVEGPVMTIRP